MAHVAAEPLATDKMPRRITVYVASPPGDGGSVRAGRELFHEYVRPVLVAGGMDWDVVEGRREGDVRGFLAGRVRRFRRRWEGGNGVPEQEQEQGQERDNEGEELRLMRERMGIKEWDGVAGDIVIGRHTWKEYVRGLHEGWLGPLEAPKRDIDETFGLVTTANTTSTTSTTVSMNDDASPTSSVSTEPPTPTPITAANTDATSLENSPQPESQAKTNPQKSQLKQQQQPPPFIHPSAYSTASLPSTIPTDLGPSTALPFPHILGFLNTPIRLRRFLMRRRLADEIGREVAGVVLGRYDEFGMGRGVEGAHSRGSNGDNNGVVEGLGDDASPVATATATAAVTSPPPPSSSLTTPTPSTLSMKQWQQAHLLEREEADWPSSFWKEKEKEKKKQKGEAENESENTSRNENGVGSSDSSSSSSTAPKESVWADDIVLDERIARRMKRFVFDG